LKKVIIISSLLSVPGAIFREDQKMSASELAFKFAVHRINKDKNLLPNTRLVYDIQYVPKDDSFHANKKVCSQIQMGVQAIFGPADSLLGAHIHSICDALDIPHIESRLDLDTGLKEFSVNLYPSQAMLNAAYQDVMNYLNWTKVAIVYEHDHGLIKLRELIRYTGIDIYIRQADITSYLSVLADIKSKEYNNLIVDTDPQHMAEFLKGVSVCYISLAMSRFVPLKGKV
jgi:glutamate receptor, ionotropic, invertebrate